MLRTTESKNVLKSVNHKLTLQETFGNDFEFFVMSDPQYGKIDQKMAVTQQNGMKIIILLFINYNIYKL